jgi:hypothetical protein
LGLGAEVTTKRKVDKPQADTTAYSLSRKPPSPPGRHDGARYLTLFRVGAMTIDGRRELCLIKNISEGGMMIRPYCDLVEGTKLTIELKTGISVGCSVVWVRDESVGVAFETPVDVIEILSKSEDGPRPRMPRIEVDCFATIRDGGLVHRVRVQDVSQGGIKVEAPVVIEKGTDLIVSLPDLDPQPAAVRWHEAGYLGITFNRLLPLPELVAWLHAMRDQLRAA